MHDLDLILTLTGGLVAALVFGYLTQRAGLSPIVGYLLAGLVVGPNTPGFVANKQLADQLAEVGVILLMFGVGLQFHLKELLEVRRIAIPGALGQILVATGLGYVIGTGMDWSWAAGTVFGLAISVASTVVLLRVLADNNDLHTPTGHIAVGWLVVEDLFTVLVLVLLPVVFGSDDVAPANVPLALFLAVAKLGALVVFTLVAGGRLIPRVLGHVARMNSRELFTLTILVLALGIAVTSAKLFGASMAIGAFLAGMVVGRSDFSQRAASEALPMRDAFAVLFFVSVGMLFDPKHLAEAPGLVAATLAVVLVGKPLAALIIVWLLRCPIRTGLAVAVALAQIGEFSFILATVARDLGLLPDPAYNALVAASILSISLNPLLYRLIDGFEVNLKKTRPGLWRVLSARANGLQPNEGRPVEPYAQKPLAIVVGYGPVGRTLTRLLHESDIEPVVIELNLDTFQELKAESIRAVYGDASRQDTLTHAGVQKAASLILSTAGMPGSQEMIRLARELNPGIRVFARSVHLREAAALREAGADTVFSGEGEVALSMTEFMLRQVGATPEQIDRERDRIRRELFGDARFVESSAETS
ncbi:MAG TPA: cation:proton antiporter [Terriglobia bacterium]|nr:cation:proton antiporter [Terriglobia bacterium]